jgi:hypothetical protein
MEEGVHKGRLTVLLVVLLGLDADAEFDVLSLIARVGIEVVRGAAVELVALPNLAPDDDTQSQRGDASRYPADVAQKRTAVVGHGVDGVLDLVADFAE